MWKFCVIALACAVSALGAIEVGFSPTLSSYVYASNISSTDPLPPNTATKAAETPQSEEKTSSPVIQPEVAADRHPVRLIIPSIKLDDTVIDVGVNAKGEMDVPNGKTKNVGWYKDGTVPGDNGTAVLDAHVFAAFTQLRYVKVGDDIYVITSQNKKLHFVVTESTVFKLNELSSQTLFGAHGYAALNLITCAGELTPDHSTYDHRLVVFTKFVGEED